MVAEEVESAALLAEAQILVIVTNIHHYTLTATMPQ